MAEDFGFHRSGERLKLARERARIMERNGTAATSNPPEGWERDHAIGFARTDRSGEVFKNARIHEEYPDARLEELEWGAAVQRLEEEERDEQRSIREQVREKERAQREIDRAVKLAQREEERINKAIDRVRASYEAASALDGERHEVEPGGLASKLKEAEDKNRRAISLAQRTERGRVHVISNVGAFGEGVCTIGLTRRPEPLDRVRELGDASVPFGFDVHALIPSDDAPALGAARHREFPPCRVDPVDRRVESSRLGLREIRRVVDELCPAVRRTMTAEARDDRESLAMDQLIRDDPEFRRRWAESGAAQVDGFGPGDEDAAEGDLLAEAAEPAHVAAV